MMMQELPANDSPLIEFHSEDVDFQLAQPLNLSNWLLSIVEEEAHSLLSLNVIFCSDDYLHKINLDFLQHDTYTDIIAFPYSQDPVQGDLFISIERVKENAAYYGASFDKELQRVMAHGLLHLLGYNDKTPGEKIRMVEKENYYIEKALFFLS